MSKPRGAVIVFMSGKQTVLHGVHVVDRPIELLQKHVEVLIRHDALTSLSNFRSRLYSCDIRSRLVLVSLEFVGWVFERCERLMADIDAEVIQVNVDTGAVTIEGDPVAKLELRKSKRYRSRNASHDPDGERRQGSHPDRKRSPSGKPQFELLGSRAPVKFVWEAVSKSPGKSQGPHR